MALLGALYAYLSRQSVLVVRLALGGPTARSQRTAALRPHVKRSAALMDLESKTRARDRGGRLTGIQGLAALDTTRYYSVSG